MQLDTTIDQRRREIDNVSNDINGERDQNENMKNAYKRHQLDLLAMKLEKTKSMFEIVRSQNLAKRYDEVSTNRFRPQYGEQAVEVLEQEQRRN